MSPFAACEDLVRRHDFDRTCAALFAPDDKRKYLFCLYAFNYETARVAEIVREPLLAEIRLAWWRETLEEARAGRPRDHDVARALAETLAANDLPQELFESMIAARSADAAPEPFADMATLENYADATSGGLMRLVARILGAAADDLAREAGIAYALAGLLRAAPIRAAQGKRHLPERLRDAAARAARSHYAAAQKMAVPRKMLSPFLPAALVPLYLKRGNAPLWRRQIVCLRAMVRGRL